MKKSLNEYTSVSIKKETLYRLRSTNPAIVGINSKLIALLDIHDSMHDESNDGTMYKTNEDGITCIVYPKEECEAMLKEAGEAHLRSLKEAVGF